MNSKEIKSFSRLVKNIDITSSNISTAIKNRTVSEKYARAIEQEYGLPKLYFDTNDNIVINNVFTLTTFDKNIPTSKVKNINVCDSCFYIQLINPSFYPAGSYILFRKIKENTKLLPNKICLIRHKGEVKIAKNKISHYLLYNEQELHPNDVSVIAEEIRVEF
jgi:hypothetical protein